MTPQRWKGAGILFLVIAALLVVAATVSALGLAVGAVPTSGGLEFIPASEFGISQGLVHGVVLGAFAGVAFFIGLACFAWSGLVEAKEQRAEILIELTALRLRAEKTDGTEKTS